MYVLCERDEDGNYDDLYVGVFLDENKAIDRACEAMPAKSWPDSITSVTKRGKCALRLVFDDTYSRSFTIYEEEVDE